MDFARALYELAASDLGSAKFSPQALESGDQGLSALLPQRSLGAPSAAPQAPAAAPIASPAFAPPTLAGRMAGAAAAPGGYVSQSLTPAAGGGVRQFSRQTPMDVETIKGIAAKRGIDPARFEKEFTTASGMSSPEDVSRMWNTMNVESGFRNRPGDYGTSVGVAQIHLPAHPEFKGWDLSDPYTSARAAGQVVKQQGWNGAYKTTSKRFGYR